MSENLDRVCEWASDHVLEYCYGKDEESGYSIIAALRAEFAELERKAASAIIPTPELRHASEVVCLAAEYSFDDFMSVEARATRTAVAIVRAAFKENDNA